MSSRFLSTAAALVVMLALFAGGAFEFAERRARELRFRFLDRPASGSVVVVDIDSRSLEALQAWPWPRGYYATVLDRLTEAGVSAVGFDIDFSSRSTAEEDQQFAEAIAASEIPVTLAIFRQWHETGEGTTLTVTRPIELLAENAGLGSINVLPEDDGRVWRYYSYGEFDGLVHPAFALAIARRTERVPNEFFIDFGIDASQVVRISFIDMLAGRIDSDVLRDKVAIVGSTALELHDQIAVPTRAIMPGPLLQALAYESIVQDRMLQQNHGGWNVAAILLILILLPSLLGRMPWRTGLGLCLLIGVGGTGLALLAQWTTSWMFDIVPTIAATTLAFVMAAVYRMERQAWQLVGQRLLLSRSERRFQRVLETSLDGILGFREDGRVESVNPSAERLFGQSECDLLLRPIDELLQSPAGLIGSLGESPTETRIDRADGTSIDVEVVVTASRAVDDAGFVAFVRDITDRKSHERELERRASFDPLTELANRYCCERRLAELIASSGESDAVAVVLLNLSGFKEVNDTLGHDFGDRLLRSVGERLSRLAEEESRVARIGGDSFAVCLDGESAVLAHEFCKSVIRDLSIPFEVEQFSLRVGAHVGIARSPEHGSDPQILLRRAETAMFEAKRRRAGWSEFHPSQDVTSVRALTLRGELDKALVGDELYLVFQPKVETRSGEITGAEALLRWEHPELGPIRPDELVAMAERTGQITEVTRWVLESGLSQIATWADRGLSLRVAMNLSALNLMDAGLPELVQAMMERYRVDPTRVILEVTENAMVDDPERALRTVQQLCELGVAISIDDFGTGYSSLAYLQQLRASELKIDRSFVKEMLHAADCAVIVESTIAMAHKLGMVVVGEGIEDDETWHRLAELGCDYGQGYHLGRPMRADDLERYALSTTWPVPGEESAHSPAIPV